MTCEPALGDRRCGTRCCQRQPEKYGVCVKVCDHEADRTQRHYRQQGDTPDRAGQAERPLERRLSQPQDDQ